MARRPGAAPDPRGFGDRAAQAGARRVDMITGAANRKRTGTPGWYPGIPLLNDGRIIYIG